MPGIVDIYCFRALHDTFSGDLEYVAVVWWVCSRYNLVKYNRICLEASSWVYHAKAGPGATKPGFGQKGKNPG